MRTALLVIRTALGICMAVLAWLVTSWLLRGSEGHPVAVLAQGIVPGMAGGALVAWLSPRERFTMAATAGVFLSIVLIGLIVALDAERGGQALLIWYWPLWIAPSFLLGAALVKRGRRLP